MKTSLFTKLAENELVIAKLEAENEKLRGKALAELQAENLDTYSDTKLGTFSVVRRKVWTYSAKYSDEQAKSKEYLAAIRKTEEENGTAKAEDKPTLAFRAPKQDES